VSLESDTDVVDLGVADFSVHLLLHSVLDPLVFVPLHVFEARVVVPDAGQVFSLQVQLSVADGPSDLRQPAFSEIKQDSNKDADHDHDTDDEQADKQPVGFVNDGRLGSSNEQQGL